jgi:hypothetical protein
MLVWLSLGIRHRKGAAYFKRESIRYFSVTGNSLNPSGIRIYPKGMCATFAFQETSVSTEMFKQGIPFHPTETISRKASAGMLRKASSLLSSRIKSMA